MLKTLLKKQFLEFAAFFLIAKDGKRRSTGVIIGFVALMLYALFGGGVMFWLMSDALCEPLVLQGRGWLYFAFMGLIATAFGVIGGVFMAKSKLYEAKDNDFLLSMPISPSMILFTRMIGLYVFTLLFFGLVFVPAAIQYFLVVTPTVLSILGCLLILFVGPLGAMGVCCILGYGLAWLTARLPFKNLFSIIAVLAFMGVYFWLYSKMNEYMGYVLANGEAVGGVMKTVLFPFAQLGYAAMGKPLSGVFFLLIFGGIFALSYLLNAFTYLRIITMKRGERQAKYKEKETKAGTAQAALLKKEFLRLGKSPIYLINTTMGTLMMLLFSCLSLIGNDVFGLSAQVPMLADSMGLMAAAVVVLLASSNTMASCSVSLEGESVWITQSLPVDSWVALKAKLYLHILMTAIPAVLASVVLGIAMDVNWIEVVCTVALAATASILFATVNLMANLKFPNLHWTNETAAVKQSLSVMVAMFGGWGISFSTIGCYFLFGKYMPAWSYILMWTGVFAVGAVALWLWLKRRGTKLYEKL